MFEIVKRNSSTGCCICIPSPTCSPASMLWRWTLQVYLHLPHNRCPCAGIAIRGCPQLGVSPLGPNSLLPNSFGITNTHSASKSIPNCPSCESVTWSKWPFSKCQWAVRAHQPYAHSSSSLMQGCLPLLDTAFLMKGMLLRAIVSDLWFLGHEVWKCGVTKAPEATSVFRGMTDHLAMSSLGGGEGRSC